MRLFSLLLIASVLASPRMFAQEHQDDRGQHREHQEGKEAAAMVVHQLFDAMRSKDTTAMRSLFHESARLQRTGRNQAGELIVGNTPIDSFIQVIGGADGYLDEQIWDAEVRIDADLATVWTKYAFFFNETFSHCGTNAVQLARLADGWKIIQISDTQRRGEENCEMPPDRGERQR